MKSPVRISALALLVIAGCSRTPTSPSQVSPAAIAVDRSGSLSGVTHAQTATIAVDWSTLTRSHGLALLLMAGQDPPQRPSDLAFVVSGTTVALTWSPPPPGPEPTTNGYVLEAGTGPGLRNIVVFNTGVAPGLIVVDVPPGSYYVRVRAANGDGVGEASNEVVVVVTATAPCSGPNAPTALTSSVSGASLSLSWTAAAAGCVATAYVIEAGSIPGASNLASINTGSAATTFFAAGVPGGTYFVRVRAALDSRLSAPSNEVAVIIGSGSSPTSVSGLWTGVAPDGMIVESNPQGQCPGEFDVQLQLAASGNTFSGTATTRLRRVTRITCGDVLGSVATWPVTNGRIDGDRVSFDFGNEGIYRFAGAFTATRMTGTFVLTQTVPPSIETGRFVVTRQ